MPAHLYVFLRCQELDGSPDRTLTQLRLITAMTCEESGFDRLDSRDILHGLGNIGPPMLR
jgi:hypothetical protein